MNLSTNPIKGRVRNTAQKVRSSSLTKKYSRKSLNYLKAYGRDKDSLSTNKIFGALERLSSEELPSGRYFAKIVIRGWEEHRGKKFKLFQNGKIVYGNKIEPPAKGFPLEYRNIPVTSLKKSNFKININAPFDIYIRPDSFTTRQQRDYDIKYGVQQHGDVFYSLRGNTVNPSKIIITFPGFGPSTTRISYAVSYLKDLTDEDLNDTLMVCFQDRYMVSGTYMVVDSAGRSLYPRVKSVIDSFLKKYAIKSNNMLLFGASKGGSIALYYAQEYPDSRLLLAVPQLSLPYYMDKPFFRYNLFGVSAFHEIDQPEELLRRYFSEGRKIDYFYTNDDELSNHSVIELAHGIKGLTKYRFDGKHGEVARAALPSMLNIMRHFLGKNSRQVITCEDVHTYGVENRLYSQVRIQDGLEESKSANWYLEANDGATVHRVALTNHSYDFVKFTNPQQSLFPTYDPIDKFNRVVGLLGTGRTYRGALPSKLEDVSSNTHPINRSFAPLSLDTQNKLEHYTIVNANSFGRFRYRSEILNKNGETAEVHLVDDIEHSTFVKPSSIQTHPTKFLMVAQSLDHFNYAQLLALRAVIKGNCKYLRLVVHASAITADDIKKLVRVDWINVQVVIVQPVTDMDYTRRPFSNWVKKKRLNILKSARTLDS